MRSQQKSEIRIPRVGILMQANRSYERGLLRGIAQYARLHGPWQFYRQLPQLSGGMKPLQSELKHWKPDGIIIREGSGVSSVMLKRTPCIYAPATEMAEALPNIVVNDFAVGQMAATHLLECGFKHFAYCGMDSRYFWSRHRREGFVSALAKAGFTPSTHRRKGKGPIHWDHDLKALSNWIKDLPTPLGMMVCNDDFTLLATEACKTAKREVPEDIALLGVGNDEAICDLATVSLSSIKLGTEQAGYRAAELLDNLMHNRKQKTDNIIVEPLNVVSRHSTDVLDLSDSYVATAIRFIRNHASRPISVDDVIKIVPLSRRTLYDRFKKATGTSIYEYIKRTRLEAFTRLLLETNLTISEISNSMHFPDEKNVSRYFRKIKGATPIAYRRKHSTISPQL